MRDGVSCRWSSVDAARVVTFSALARDLVIIKANTTTVVSVPSRALANTRNIQILPDLDLEVVDSSEVFIMVETHDLYARRKLHFVFFFYILGRRARA